MSSTYFRHRFFAETRVVAALCAIWMVCTLTASSQTFTILHNFDNAEGAYSYFDTLTQGLDGNLWGTTFAQGSFNDGTAYRITPSGGFKVLNNFSSMYPQPVGALALAPSGTFYGVTPAGGTNSAGTLFGLKNGNITVLYSFSGPDGSKPFAPLTLGSDGNLYGTTEFGGSTSNGTIFQITPSGLLITLHSFGTLGDDGYTPEGSGLVQTPDGAFYGVCPGGGPQGQGVVFRITSTGDFSVLHNFDFTHGAAPLGTLALATDGNLYGTALRGGQNQNGIIFRISLAGKFSVVHNFVFSSDGGGPAAGLVQATDGKFYGTTEGGGANGYGTIYSVTSGGSFSVVQNFDFQAVDVDGLMQHTNGRLYGVTQYGGTSNNGVIFSLDVGAPRFIGLLPAFGNVGSQVEVLGTALSGSTAVTFNGIPAVFKVVSATLISATVPAGATSGTVQVSTPAGTLRSKSSFTILPAAN